MLFVTDKVKTWSDILCAFQYLNHCSRESDAYFQEDDYKSKMV